MAYYYEPVIWSEVEKIATDKRYTPEEAANLICMRLDPTYRDKRNEEMFKTSLDLVNNIRKEKAKLNGK